MGHQAVQIGFVFDSRKLTIGSTCDYLDPVLDSLQSERPKGFTDFTLKSIVTVEGKLARLSEAAPWVFHLMNHIYASIANNLRSNYASLLKEDKSFQNNINGIKKFRLLPIT